MATQQLNISSLTTKTVNTQDGPKEVWVVNGKYSSFKGIWNKDWAVGATLKGVFSTREKDGKTYHNIGCPPELKPQGGGLNTELLKQIAGQVNAILAILRKAEEPEPAGEPVEDNSVYSSGPTPVEDEINVEDIPF